MKRRLYLWFKRIFLGLLLTMIFLVGSTHLYVQYRIVSMPGETYGENNGVINGETDQMAARLRTYVELLTTEIGGRSIYNTAELDKTKGWIISEFTLLGLEPQLQTYQVEPELYCQAHAVKHQFQDLSHLV